MRDNDFPGRWVTGTSLVLGPLLLLAGTLLRSGFHFFFPQQLAAYAEHPGLVVAAYTCFAAGNLLLWPGILALARSIGLKHPLLAAWGGCLVIFGLFARTFHAGADLYALLLVDSLDQNSAVNAVARFYPAWGELSWHPVRVLAPAIVFGWIVLAVGAYRSRTLGLVASVALGLACSQAIGILKGTELPQSLIAVGGLCVALIPLGVRELLSGPRPSGRALAWLAVVGALVGLGVHFEV
ncbi:hypothetical protein [Allokutzneria sp. NRRL B-24872]|uniref:hypothetical protein n=1 Tax=Allokutzneria sp. NRRL B-24872 TaxID=1137961 RepID=UPI001AEFCD50|nr:hypothetical protein [Allokutzneria sp. NRRL B-24872]